MRGPEIIVQLLVLEQDIVDSEVPLKSLHYVSSDVAQYYSLTHPTYHLTSPGLDRHFYNF